MTKECKPERLDSRFRGNDKKNTRGDRRAPRAARRRKAAPKRAKGNKARPVRWLSEAAGSRSSGTRQRAPAPRRRRGPGGAKQTEHNFDGHDFKKHCRFVQINEPQYFAPPAAEFHSAAGALTACGAVKGDRAQPQAERKGSRNAINKKNYFGFSILNPVASNPEPR